MKTKKNKNIKLAVFLIAIFSFIFILGACEDIPETDPEDDVADMYFEDGEIEEDHTVGSTDCPQNLATLVIWPSGKNGTLEKADSCSISDNSMYIDTYVNEDKASFGCRLDENSSCSLYVDFNCGKAEDVNTEMECSFYSDNVEIYKKVVSVNVNVKN